MGRLTMVVIVAAIFIFCRNVSAYIVNGSDEFLKVEQLSKLLSLSPKQKEKLIDEREKSGHKMLGLEVKWQRLGKILQREMEVKQPNRKSIEGITEAMGKVQGDILLLRVHSLIYLKSLLTPEQMAILYPKSGKN